METATKSNPEQVEDLNAQIDSTSNVRLDFLNQLQADPEEEIQRLEQQKQALEKELKAAELEEGENKHIIHLGKENDLDERSVFVKNVHFSATEAEIREHFQECGEIKRVTILHDKMANQPKGQGLLAKMSRHLYIEFANQEAVMKSMRLNETLFKGRQITIMPKRKNVPGRGRGGFRGRNPMHMMASMLNLLVRGGGRGFRRGRPF